MMSHQFPEHFHEEVLLKIASHLPVKSMLNLGGVCSFFKNICDDQRLWKNAVSQNFGIYEKHKDELRSWKEIYKFLHCNAQQKAKVLKTALQFINHEKNHDNSETITHGLFNHAKHIKRSIEKSLGEVDASYIYQYLTRKIDFIAPASYDRLEAAKLLLDFKTEDSESRMGASPVILAIESLRPELLLLVSLDHPTIECSLILDTLQHLIDHLGDSRNIQELFEDLYRSEKIKVLMKNRDFQGLERFYKGQPKEIEILKPWEYKLKMIISWLIVKSCDNEYPLIDVRYLEESFGIERQHCEIHYEMLDEWLNPNNDRCLASYERSPFY